MDGTIDAAGEAPAIRLERGGVDDARGPAIARGTDGFVSRIGFARAGHDRAAPTAETLPARDKAAFTLRLDPARHTLLKARCAASHRSAQQIVTQALDAFLATASAPRRAGALISTGGF